MSLNQNKVHTRPRCIECQQPRGAQHAGWCSKVGGSGVLGMPVASAAARIEMRELPSPTPEEQADPLFVALFNVIKLWDIRTEHDTGYCGGNGSHALLLLNAVREELILELAIIRSHPLVGNEPPDR